jgi:D-sedoheptulose 7-phosphate isomerase
METIRGRSYRLGIKRANRHGAKDAKGKQNMSGCLVSQNSKNRLFCPWRSWRHGGSIYSPQAVRCRIRLQICGDRPKIPGMADFVQSYIQEHTAAAQRVAAELSTKIQQVGKLLCDTFASGGKLLTFGNGGSAADAQHLAEEMIGKFLRQRRPLPAVALTADGTAVTCISNDFGYEEVFARQVRGLANRGDVVIGISTSGNSENVLRGLRAAKEKSATTVALLGSGGGKAAAEAEHTLIVPASTSYHIQEMHIVIVHLLCDIVDRWAV